MESNETKRDIARRALLGEEVESLQEEIQRAPTPLVRLNRNEGDHSDIKPLSFDDDEPRTPAITPPPHITKKREQKNAKQLFALKTYRDDVAHTAQKKDEPLNAIKAHGLTMRAAREKHIQTHYEKHIITIAAVILLAVIIGTITTIVAINSYGTRTPAPTTEQAGTAVRADSTTDLNLDSQSRLTIMSLLREHATTPGTHIIRLQSSDATEITGQDLLGVLGTSPPASLDRALTGPATLGTRNGTPFIILTTESFDQSFSGLLNWESRMALDLGAFFSQSPQQGAFRDISIDGQSIRTLNLGTTDLMYGFITRNHILISGNEDVFRDLSTDISQI